MILDEICAHKREEVDATKGRTSLKELEEQIERAPAPVDFRLALREEGISLIAEIKRASPVKGDFSLDADVGTLANVYALCGARAISVLTDNKYFKGSVKDFLTVRHEVGIPCLRKEFIIDAYQVYESRSIGADAILLIVRILSDGQLKDYLELAAHLGMGVLVETHDETEVERALKAGAHIIGVNNRDLETFRVDIDTTLRLRRLVPGGRVLVSESGIQTREDVQRLDDGGVDAILVGEALVTSRDIEATIRELLGESVGQNLRH